jgi:hypothetical protein
VERDLTGLLQRCAWTLTIQQRVLCRHGLIGKLFWRLKQACLITAEERRWPTDTHVVGQPRVSLLRHRSNAARSPASIRKRPQSRRVPVGESSTHGLEWLVSRRLCIGSDVLFVSIIDGRTRSNFALASRSARTIEVESGCTMRLTFGNGTGHRRPRPYSSPVPRPGRLARRGGGVNGGALRHRSATPPGAIDSADGVWTISGRGNGDPNPKI